jgi:hypothetical protein
MSKKKLVDSVYYSYFPKIQQPMSAINRRARGFMFSYVPFGIHLLRSTPAQPDEFVKLGFTRFEKMRYNSVRSGSVMAERSSSERGLKLTLLYDMNETVSYTISYYYASFNFVTIDKMLNLTYIKNSTIKNSDADNYKIDDVHCMHVETCT